jgi:predicted peptidase
MINMKIYKIFPISIIVTILFIGGCKSTVNQTEVKTGQYEQSLEKEIKTTINVHYMLYIPEEYSTSEKEWPLILFLHGAGERGDDLSKVLVHGPPKLIAKENKKFPFVIVSPQCPERDSWSSKMQIATLNALLDEIVSKYRIDQKRIYVTGLSMGGFGTWTLAAAYPDRFAAIAPICGGGNPEDAEKIAHLPIWVFHGAKDQTVPIERSEEMVEALKKAGSQVKFTVYPEANHDSWTVTYENPELYDWFLQHTNPSIK